MRDYLNGGFFFIDVAPIIAAGEEGLKIDGIYEDVKRAIEGGKMFSVSNITFLDKVCGAMCGYGIILEENLQIIVETGGMTFTIYVTNDDIVAAE